MAADLSAHAELGGAALDHAPSIDAAHRLVGQRAGAAGGGAEEGSLATVTDARRSFLMLYLAAATRRDLTEWGLCEEAPMPRSVKRELGGRSRMLTRISPRRPE
jgi:hypothetical protein